MEHWFALLGWAGIFSPMVLGAIGSTVGCARAGQAACGAFLDLDGGYGRFLGMSVLPSTQAVLGIVIMFTLNREVTIANGPGLFSVGLLAGLALMLSAIFQGYAVASAIHVAKNKPEVLGIAIAPAAIVEGFAVFAFVCALVLAGALPVV